MMTAEIEKELHVRLYPGGKQPIVGGLTAQERLNRIDFKTDAFIGGFLAGVWYRRTAWDKCPYPLGTSERDAWELGEDEGYCWRRESLSCCVTSNGR